MAGHTNGLNWSGGRCEKALTESPRMENMVWTSAQGGDHGMDRVWVSFPPNFVYMESTADTKVGAVYRWILVSERTVLQVVACKQMTRSSSLGMSHEGGGGAVGMRPMITVCSKCEANQLRGPRLRHDLDGWRGGGCRTGLVFRLWLGYSHIVGGQSNESG